MKFGRDPSKPYKPPDAAEIETFLDFMARMMAHYPRDAHLMLPIWRALERELKIAQDAEAIIIAARERVRRLTDRMAERSS